MLEVWSPMISQYLSTPLISEVVRPIVSHQVACCSMGIRWVGVVGQCCTGWRAAHGPGTPCWQLLPLVLVPSCSVMSIISTILSTCGVIAGVVRLCRMIAL